jgi:hypothetical protein
MTFVAFLRMHRKPDKEGPVIDYRIDPVAAFAFDYLSDLSGPAKWHALPDRVLRTCRPAGRYYRARPPRFASPTAEGLQTLLEFLRTKRNAPTDVITAATQVWQMWIRKEQG